MESSLCPQSSSVTISPSFRIPSPPEFFLPLSLRHIKSSLFVTLDFVQSDDRRSSTVVFRNKSSSCSVYNQDYFGPSPIWTLIQCIGPSPNPQTLTSELTECLLPPTPFTSVSSSLLNKVLVLVIEYYSWVLL